MTSKKIMIIEDHPVVRHGLEDIINSQKDLEVICSADGREEALEELSRHKIDLATMDISLKDCNGIELIKDIKNLYPDIHILVLSMHDESLYAERVLRAGASGYIMKQSIMDDLLGAIRRVLSGQIYLSHEMSTFLLGKSLGHNQDPAQSDIQNLSDRELEVFQCIGEGLTTREISEHLQLGVKTVETYKMKIKEKLNIDNATQLVKQAVLWLMNEKKG